jgi:hypothetical protein
MGIMDRTRELAALRALADGSPGYESVITCVNVGILLTAGDISVCDLGSPLEDIQSFYVFGCATASDSGLWGWALTNRDPSGLTMANFLANAYPDSPCFVFHTGPAGTGIPVSSRFGRPRRPYRYLLFMDDTSRVNVEATIVVDRFLEQSSRFALAVNNDA